MQLGVNILSKNKDHSFIRMLVLSIPIVGQDQMSHIFLTFLTRRCVIPISYDYSAMLMHQNRLKLSVNNLSHSHTCFSRDSQRGF